MFYGSKDFVWSNMRIIYIPKYTKNGYMIPLCKLDVDFYGELSIVLIYDILGDDKELYRVVCV
jgi:hypothetical protein